MSKASNDGESLRRAGRHMGWRVCRRESVRGLEAVGFHARRPSLLEAGHAHVQERYDCEALDERWERLYDGLVAGALPTQEAIDAPLTRPIKG